MSQSETVGKLAEAMAKAQLAVKSASFDAVNPFLKNKYATLGAVIDACRAALSEHGISVVQPVEMDGDRIGVRTVLMHSSGEWISSTATLPIGEEKGKSAAQVAGSIITYLRRYSLASMVGVYADEDTDGNAPEQKKPQQAKPAAAREPDAPLGTALKPQDSNMDNHPNVIEYRRNRETALDLHKRAGLVFPTEKAGADWFARLWQQTCSEIGLKSAKLQALSVQQAPDAFARVMDAARNDIAATLALGAPAESELFT